MKNFKKRAELGLKLALAFGFLISTVLPFAAVKAAPTPVPGNPAWKAEYSKSANKGTPAPVLRDRGNAAGDKISSNAHSADYLGLYFYWDDKQKDDGVLLVNENVFEYFKDNYTVTLPNVDKKQAANSITFAKGEHGFVLTAKNSNNYWGFKISKKTGQIIDTINGVKIYAYAIPKRFQFINDKGKNDKEDLKNINMVFIDGQFKPAYVLLSKAWFDEEGKLIWKPFENVALNKELAFSNGLKLGLNEEDFGEVTFSSYVEAMKGKTLNITETKFPAGYEFKAANVLSNDGFHRYINNGVSLTLKPGEKAAVLFENQKQWAYITIEKERELLSGSVAPDAEFNIYDLDDNLIEGPVSPGTYQVKAGTYKVVEEGIPGFTLVTANNIEVDVAAGGSETVSFTNNEDRATVTLTKVRVDADGEITDEPEGAEFKWTGNYETGTVKAGTPITIGEEFVKYWTEEDEEGIEWAYEVTLIEISGVDSTNLNNTEDGVDFIAKSGEEYNIVFTNQVTKIEMEKFATVSVIKKWIDADGKRTRAPRDITAELTNDWEFTTYSEVEAGTEIQFEEKDIPNRKTVPTSNWRDVGAPSRAERNEWSNWKSINERTEDGITYTQRERTGSGKQLQTRDIETTTYKFFSVSTNGVISYDNDVKLTAEGGKIYAIIFTNQIVVTTGDEQREKSITGRQTKITEYSTSITLNGGDKIPSESHIGKRWNGSGVIALGGSSVSHHGTTGEYLIALGERADDKVYIGYGNKEDRNALDYIFSFDKFGNIEVIKGIFNTGSVDKGFGGTIRVDSPPHNIKGEVSVDVRYIFKLHDSGKRHIYLLNATEVEKFREFIDKPSIIGNNT